MYKSQKDYVKSRIQSELHSKKFKCSCKEPDLEEHLRSAIAEGSVKLRKSEEIKKEARAKVLNGRYAHLDLDQIFLHPDTYKKAMHAYKAEKKSIKADNDALEMAAQSIIDKVFLDKYEDPEVAIAEFKTKSA